EEDSKRMKEIQNEKEERAVKFVQQQLKQKAEEDRQRKERRMMMEEEQKRLKEEEEARRRQDHMNGRRELLKKITEKAVRNNEKETLDVRRQMSMQERASTIQSAKRPAPPNGFYAVPVDESLEMLPPRPRTSTFSTSTPRLTQTFL
ncbi:hypothetical protein PENTCL1PPCAC_28178, partial [Pristionchus entomophagus]